MTYFSLFKKEVNFVPIDLSGFFPLSPPQAFHSHIFDQLGAEDVGYGGYLENRSVYAQSPLFKEGDSARSVHLGVDFWAEAGTPIFAPLEGVVLGKSFNDGLGNYGGTLLIRHTFPNGHKRIALYGHLDINSVSLESGQSVGVGGPIGELGTFEHNGGWPPHLHFQWIQLDHLDEMDFPGVCFNSEKEKFKDLCPDPNTFFQYER